MAKTKAPKRGVDSYTIKGTNKVVKVGDTVVLRNQEADKPPYVARVDKMWADGRNNVKVEVRWYYRPEESLGGRRQFHGAKEVFLSDHTDIQSADTIEGKCNVHTFKSYIKLENVENEDYFCRFEYKASTGAFTPDRVAVYCKCEMPYNPDDLMVQCEECKDWFHPGCMNLTIEEVKKLAHFFCTDCASAADGDKKILSNGQDTSPESKTQKGRKGACGGGRRKSIGVHGRPKLTHGTKGRVQQQHISLPYGWMGMSKGTRGALQRTWDILASSFKVLFPWLVCEGFYRSGVCVATVGWRLEYIYMTVHPSFCIQNRSVEDANWASYKIDSYTSLVQ